MGFWSDLDYYRPTTPPMVTAAALCDFVERFVACGCTEEGGWLKPKGELKFGQAIDQDNLPVTYEEDVVQEVPLPWWRRLWNSLAGAHASSGNIYSAIAIKDIEWDYVEEHDTLPSLAASLRRLDPGRPVYRALISLGLAADSVVRAIDRIDSPENEVNLALSDCYLSVMPIEVSLLPGDDVFHVGWMALSLSGQGYMFPWKFCDLARRAAACPELRAASSICRDMWPVRAQQPDQALMETRRKMGQLWPFPIDAPVDWTWGIYETG